MTNTNDQHYQQANKLKHHAQREKETRNAIKKGQAHWIQSVKEMMDILENPIHKHE